MTEAIRVVPKLLLTFLFLTGSHRNDFLVFADSRYIKYSCSADIVCFYLWNFGTSKPGGFIGIVSNGEMGTSESPGDDSKCYLPFEDLTAEDVGGHQCRKESGVVRSYRNAPVLKLTPEKPVALQCVFLKYVKYKHCYHLSQKVRLTWVDESGAQIEEDPQHQIQHQSPCAVTLHMALKSPQTRTVRCQMTVGDIVQTSVQLLVRLPERKGKRILFEPEHQEHNQQDVIGAAVGVVGCVVLTAMVAAFVVNKRRARTNTQPSDESLNTVDPNNEADINDVIYTEIMFPAGTGRKWVKECEDTEYAAVRY
ncbi:uncharacterized protein LOC114457866 [Gouania willdenowi]|uniref:uncharacterized protein LOC114457866 n=1 Tax=Gouania willdenowi TaxID=441366 RepID=UPI0010565655|nr:uncharacterized protein LOC114457866 [Gouania willdenowi]